MIYSRHCYSYILLLSLCTLSTFVGLLCETAYSAEFRDRETQEAVTASRQTAIVTAVAHASPAVVNISAIRTVERRTSFVEWWFWDDMPHRRRRSLREVGSGIIIDKKGHILTNHHVIKDADSITVTISDGREFTARVIGFDYLADLSLLEVDAGTALPEIQWGDSDTLMIGEWVVAIGNPFNLSIGDAQPTVTVGIVSATQRAFAVEDRYHEDLIQTDASINPGNSGGALVNIHGQLIGINTVIRSTSGGSQGVGFAIPVNKARKVIQQILEYGSVIPPYFGIKDIQPVTEDLAEKLSMPHNTGILVSKVEKRSPAADAGIKRGDVIIDISGYRIKGENDFTAVTRLLPLHQPTACELIRRGKKRQIEFTLKTLEWDYTPSGWGLTLSQPDKAMARKYRQSGIIITNIERGSNLSNVLQRGDFIYQIDDIKIHSLEFFKIVVDEFIRTQSGMQLYFERDGAHKTIPITFNRNNQRR
jgi:Do/DeqQ family serine protease